MVRKLVFLMLPVTIGLLLWSCSSPTDVPANRNITEEIIPLQFEPAEIVAEAESHGKPLDYSFEVTIQNTSESQSMDITSLDFKQGDQGFILPTSLLPLHLEPLETATIPLSLSAPADGVYTDTLVVNSNDEVSCPIHITVLPDINYTVIVTQLNFGIVNVGETYDREIAIHNQGDAPATLTAINISGPDADILTVLPLNLPITIKAGSVFVFQVRASPVQAGDFKATLKADILYNGTGAVDDTVPLYGTAE